MTEPTEKARALNEFAGDDIASDALREDVEELLAANEALREELQHLQRDAGDDSCADYVVQNRKLREEVERPKRDGVEAWAREEIRQLKQAVEFLRDEKMRVTDAKLAAAEKALDRISNMGHAGLASTVAFEALRVIRGEG